MKIITYIIIALLFTSCTSSINYNARYDISDLFNNKKSSKKNNKINSSIGINIGKVFR